MCRVASSPAFLSISTRSGSCRSTHSALACSLDRAGSGGSCACRRLSCLSAPLWHRQLDGGAWYGQTDVWSRFTRDQRRPWFVVALGRWRGCRWWPVGYSSSAATRLRRCSAAPPENGVARQSTPPPWPTREGRAYTSACGGWLNNSTRGTAARLTRCSGAASDLGWLMRLLYGAAPRRPGSGYRGHTSRTPR